MAGTDYKFLPIFHPRQFSPGKHLSRRVFLHFPVGDVWKSKSTIRTRNLKRMSFRRGLMWKSLACWKKDEWQVERQEATVSRWRRVVSDTGRWKPIKCLVCSANNCTWTRKLKLFEFADKSKNGIIYSHSSKVLVF